MSVNRLTQYNEANKKPSDAQSDPQSDYTDAISCTQKCRDAMAAQGEMKGRTRQYCMLLTREDKVSQQASVQMQSKVDLSRLIAAGFIDAGYIDADMATLAATAKPKSKAIRKPAITTQRVKPLRKVGTGVTDRRRSVSDRTSPASTSLATKPTISPMLQFAAGID